MKIKYPAGAAALAMVLFSGSMTEAFAAGVLVLAVLVFAEFLKNLLKPRLVQWSLWACVLIASGAVSACAFKWAWYALAWEMPPILWVMTFAVGLLAALQVLKWDMEADYGEMFWQTAVLWFFWILLAAAREFAAFGDVAGNHLADLDFMSSRFGDPIFGFLTGGLALAFVNGVLKTTLPKGESLFIMVPAVIFAQPYVLDSLPEVAGLVITIAVPLILFWSVRHYLRFSQPGRAYRNLPVEMLSMGLIYMILSIY